MRILLKLVMVGLGLDLFTNLLTCFGSLGKREVAILGRDHSQLLNDIEEGILALVRNVPALGDSAGKDLLVRSRGLQGLRWRQA